MGEVEETRGYMSLNSRLLQLARVKQATGEESEPEGEDEEAKEGACARGKERIKEESTTMTGCLPENLTANYNRESSFGQKLSQVYDERTISNKLQAEPTELKPASFESPNLQNNVVTRSLPDDCESNLGRLNNNIANDKHRTRFYIAFMGLAIAAVNCYAQATFCIAIVEMVVPADLGASVKEEPGDQSSAIRIDDDRSCPIEYRYRDYYDSWRFPANLTGAGQQSATGELVASNLIDLSDRFDWDASRQGVLLGAFAIGTVPFQVLSGRLAEIYGAKWVLLIGCLGTAITNLTIPVIARHSFLLLVLNRVLMGVAQAGMEPGLMCLLAGWLTPDETGLFISMLLFAICIGFFLGSLGSSFLLTSGYGWPMAYYVSGSMNLIVALVWFVYATSWPRQSQHISQEELSYIETAQQVARAPKPATDDLKARAAPRQQQRQEDKPIGLIEQKLALSPPPQPIGVKHSPQKASISSPGAPWRNIVRARSVWAFIICKISVRWCADVVAMELPTYLANVLHLSIKLNGILNSVSSALFAIFSFVAGFAVNELLKVQQQHQQQLHRANHGSTLKEQITMISREAPMPGYLKLKLSNLSKTNLRKTMQSLASFGSALTVFLMTRYDCNIIVSMSMMLILSCCLVLGTGGELQIPYDMTSRYPGTLHGMACTLSVSGWLAPPLIGLILGDQPNSRYRWSIVWYLTALINLIGGLVFLLFADASPRDFDLARETTTTTRGKQDVGAAGPAVVLGWKRCRTKQEEEEEEKKKKTNGVERKSNTMGIPSCSGSSNGGNNSAANSIEIGPDQQVKSNNRRRSGELDGYCNQLCSSQDNSPVLQPARRSNPAAARAQPSQVEFGREAGADNSLVFSLAGRRRRASLPGLDRPEVAARKLRLVPLARLAAQCTLGRRRRKRWRLVLASSGGPPDASEPIQQFAGRQAGVEARKTITHL